MTNRDSDINLGEFVQMMDAVDVMRRQNSAVYDQLNEPQQRSELKDKLKASYIERGVKISDFQAEKAVDDYFSKRWEFNPGQTGKSDNLWNAYVHRGWITKHVLIPAAAIGIGVMATTGIVKHANEQRLVAQEESIENSVEASYQRRINLENEFQRVTTKQPDYLNGGEVSQIGNLAEQASVELDKTTSFLNLYCPDGIADDVVTRENMYQVAEEHEATENQLNTGKNHLKGIEGIVSTATECEGLRGKITSLFSKLNETKPHKNLSTRAKSAYETGIHQTETRALVEARRSFRNLSNLFTDSQTFNELTGSLPNLYSAIKKSSKQQKAVDMGQTFYDTGERAIETGNLNSLKATTQNMRNLLTTLNQSYTINVLQRPGYRSGLWRKSDDHPPRNSNDEDPQGKMFYLVCEARDSSSNAPISIKLKNSETDRVDSVSIFGKEVPHEVYLRIKADIIDNGRLDNSSNRRKRAWKGLDNKLFSKKEVGFIDEMIIMTDNNGRVLPDMGQITKEDRGFRK